MFFICVISLLSWYTMQINKSTLPDIQPTTEISNMSTYKKTSNKKNISNHKKVSSWYDDTYKENINNQNNSLQWDSRDDFSNEEIYEEIILHDDFDKEYWNDVDSIDSDE